MITSIRHHPFVRTLIHPVVEKLIELDPLGWYRNKDWQAIYNHFCHPNLLYPSYYKEHDFHSIEGGYLNVQAALSYDAISQFLLLPNERMIRRQAIAAVQGQPKQILDLGCGTGSMTLMLEKTFPDAEIMGLDLSPYMLAIADSKAQKLHSKIRFLHGNAEHTGLPSKSFDLITVVLLFHEVPSTIAQIILKEMYRLLVPGGEVIILDGNQQSLQRVSWVDQLFDEPHLKSYTAGNTNHWLQSAGFEQVQTEYLWWIHQISRGVKPINHQKPQCKSAVTCSA